MVVFTKVTLDAKKITAIDESFKIVEEDWKNLHYNYAKKLEKSMKRQLVSQTKKAPRTNSAQQIRAVKQSGTTSVIKMPMKLKHLDSMKPHYVSLKRGRAITLWVRKYYQSNYPGGQGKSRVRRGPRGGISFQKTKGTKKFKDGDITGGFLYVTPDPFTETAIIKVDNWLRNEIIRIFEKMKLI